MMEQKKVNNSLFVINNTYLSLIREIEDNDGEVTDEQLAALEATQEDFKAKIEAYYHVIKANEGTIALAKEEAKRLTAIAKRKDASIDRMKNVMINALHNFVEPDKKGKIKYDGGLFTVALRDNSVYRFVDDYIIKLIEYFIEYVSNNDEIMFDRLCTYLTLKMQLYYTTVHGFEVPNGEYLNVNTYLLSDIKWEFKRTFSLLDILEMDNVSLKDCVVNDLDASIKQESLVITTPKADIKAMHSDSNGYTIIESRESVTLK